MESRVRRNTGFTLIDLLIVVAIIGIVGTTAVPGLLRARMSGNEASAVASLRAINNGETAFSKSCGRGGYATTLEDLAKPPPGSSQGFVSPDLKSNGATKAGYIFTLVRDKAADTTAMAAVSTCNAAAAPASSYFAKADPVTAGRTGIRFFATDTRGGIFYDAATIANPITVTTVVQ